MSNDPDTVGSSKSPMKMMIIVGAILVGEAGLVIGAMKIIGGPASVNGDVALPEAEPEEEKIVEVLVLDAKLPNTRSGIAYIYDTEIYVQIRNKHQIKVSDELDRFKNEIKADLAAIWKTAEPRHFQEPKLESMTRKVFSLLAERFGNDPESGEPIIQKCVIVSGTGFRVDG